MEEEELRHLHEDMLEENQEEEVVQHEERAESGEQHMEERSRPTTPKWWRPPIPPETYLWEEIRRKRQQGGYPWTLLDKDLNYGDNLYEPVNPPPLYGSKYNVSSSKKDPDSTSLDERMIEIPPEIEIITSEGLDGLDQPDPHDALGVDGDREWTSFHHDHDDSQVVPSSKTSFTAGIRSQELPKVGETSNVRPLTSKTITFSPDVPPDEESSTATEAQPQVPEDVPEEPTTSKPSALDQLKTKAGQVKQRISKISLPVRPKFNQWTGIRLTKRKKDQKKDQDQEPEEQQVPEGGGWTEPLSLVPEAEKKPVSTPEPTAAAVVAAPPEPMDVDQSSSHKQSETSQAIMQDSKKASEAVVTVAPPPEVAEDDAAQKKKLAEDEKKRKDEELKRLKAEEKLQREREQEEVKRLKEQEKLQKQKEAEEQKRLKAEEKARKEKEAEEQKRLKAEEKVRKEKEKEELKKQKEEEKQRQLLLQQEMKRAQEEEVFKAKELEDEARQTRETEENVKETAAAAPAQESEPQLDVPVMESTLESTSTAKTPEKKRKLIDIDFTKRFKRSKTPPPRPEPPKMKITKPPRAAPPQNQLAAQYAEEIKARDEELQAEDNRLREPQIFVTQPSIETVSSETPSDAQQQEKEDKSWGGEDIPRRTQRVVYDADNEEYEEEVGEEDMDEERVPTPGKQSKNKENLDKIGRKFKGFGIKSKAIAAQTGKSLGQTMKNVGHGIKEFGVNAVQEVKAKQEAVRQRDAQRREEQAARAAEGGDEDAEPSGGEQMLQKFRFRKRDKKPAVGRPEGQMVLEQLPEEREAPTTPQRTRARPTDRDEGDDKVHRSQLLGRAERDWESPLDLAQSRDASEEPFSGNASSRDSPPGSSMASSSIMQGRRQGVLEEIDSDEFFLRERGISEGEDEEEVNRFLVEELRQAFRPTMSNALDGFDLPSPPDRPERSPRKPPRKGNKSSNNFQTFPPERPKRQRAPGYISSYINANPDEADYDNIEQEEEGEEDIGPEEEEEELLDEDEGIRRVKEELRKIDQELEDDGRYEPVAEDQEEPVKPARRRRKCRKSPEPQQDVGFYYNTIAANEWMRDLEDQIEGDDGPQPVPPKRVKSKSGSLAPDIDDSEINFADEDIETERTARVGGDHAPPLAQAESEGQIDGASPDLDDALDYVDEAGYAVVHKDTPSLPKTFPRKKKRGRGGNGSKGNSLKRHSQEVRPTPSNSTTVVTPADAAGTGTTFFSLPRYTPRTFHIVPPTRPHRAYSTLRPKRPPRHKSKSNQNLHGSANVATTISPAPSPRPTTPASPGSRRDGDDRPSTAIGIQGRPLPAPPRPERSPAPTHDLDPESFERMVNMRHYANFDEDAGGVEVQEELCVARNIPLLSQRDPDETSELSINDINVAVQTDPIQDEEYELNIAAGSFEEDMERIEKQSSVSHLIASDDQDDQGDELPPPIPERPQPRLPPQSAITPPQLVFPTRLHLDELEVDVLRVNDLTANSLSLTQIQAPHLELNTLSARGPLSVPSITTPNLTVDRVDCRRLSSEAAEVPSISIPPPSFYNLACPPVQPSLCPESSEECPDGGQDSCVCPSSEESPSIDAQSQQVVSQSAPSQPPITRSSTLASSTHTADPDLEDIATSSVRLGRALLRVTVRTLQVMAEYVEVAASNDPECKEQQRSNMQVLMCLLLVLVAGIILISRSSGGEPRWQYFLPPSDI